MKCNQQNTKGVGRARINHKRKWGKCKHNKAPRTAKKNGLNFLWFYTGAAGQRRSRLIAKYDYATGASRAAYLPKSEQRLRSRVHYCV